MTLFTEATARGFLLTIDGPNGAGKTTLAEAVAARLATAGEVVHTTRQPSPAQLGDIVRALEPEVRGRALACLVAGDRHHQMVTEIIPKLAEGAIVLCDRYIESSLVLQRLDGVDVDYILAINAGIPRPNLRIRLLAHPKVLEERLSKREATHERRFERTATRVRELELYEQADEILREREQLPALAFDTTSTHAHELGDEVAELVVSMR